MTKKEIEKSLRHSLIDNGKMSQGLYEYELEELLNEFKASMTKDNDDYIFAVTENSGDVAMALIEGKGQVHINEQAREKLKALWLDAYEDNIVKIIPIFAKQLIQDEIPVNGVKMAVIA